jgi:hypothetical protein
MPVYKLEITPEDHEYLTRILDAGRRSDDGGKGQTIWERSVPCGAYEVDIRVVNGLDPEDAPWIDAIIFEDGHEVGCLDVRDAIVGSYEFHDQGVVVEIPEPASPAPRP